MTDAHLIISFDREADLDSLQRFLSENVLREVTVEFVASDTAPDNAMAGQTLEQLLVTFAGTGAVSGTLLVVREWLKTRVVRIKLSTGNDGERAVEVTAVNAAEVLQQVESVLTRMLEEGREHGAD
jgi:hypothetical protein